MKYEEYLVDAIEDQRAVYLKRMTERVNMARIVWFLIGLTIGISIPFLF